MIQMLRSQGEDNNKTKQQPKKVRRTFLSESSQKLFLQHFNSFIPHRTFVVYHEKKLFIIILKIKSKFIIGFFNFYNYRLKPKVDTDGNFGIYLVFPSCYIVKNFTKKAQYN